MGVGLEPTSNSARSVTIFQCVVELDLLHWHFCVSVWLRSIVGLQISLSESGAPFFVEGWMWGQLSGRSISSEEVRTGLIESFLIGHEAKSKNKRLIETYSWLLNLSLVLWKSSSLTKHLLEILV